MTCLTCQCTTSRTAVAALFLSLSLTLSFLLSLLSLHFNIPLSPSHHWLISICLAPLLYQYFSMCRPLSNNVPYSSLKLSLSLFVLYIVKSPQIPHPPPTCTVSRGVRPPACADVGQDEMESAVCRSRKSIASSEVWWAGGGLMASVSQ